MRAELKGEREQKRKTVLAPPLTLLLQLLHALQPLANDLSCKGQVVAHIISSSYSPPRPWPKAVFVRGQTSEHSNYSGTKGNCFISVERIQSLSSQGRQLGKTWMSACQNPPPKNPVRGSMKTSHS